MKNSMQRFDIAPNREVRERESGSAAADFIAHNNIVPIIFTMLVLSGGGALAASNPEVQQAVLATQQTVQSVDNTYIVNVDLNEYKPKVEIVGITEDTTTYYVNYHFYTIDINDNSVWVDVVRSATLKVAKDALRGGDLGLFVEKELAQLTDNELVRLKETQAIQRTRGVSQKTVATEYSGIIGKFIDPTQETFPGYEPVISAPPITESPVPAQITTLLSTEEEARKRAEAAATAAAIAEEQTPVSPTGPTNPSQTPPAESPPLAETSTSTPPIETPAPTPQPDPVPEPTPSPDPAPETPQNPPPSP